MCIDINTHRHTPPLPIYLQLSGSVGTQWQCFLALWMRSCSARLQKAPAQGRKFRRGEQHNSSTSYQQSPSHFSTVHSGVRLYLSSFPSTPTHCALGTGCWKINSEMNDFFFFWVYFPLFFFLKMKRLFTKSAALHKHPRPYCVSPHEFWSLLCTH